MDNFQILYSGKLAIVVLREYRVGIIGYGWAATAHIEAINATSQGQVAAVYSSRTLDSASLSAQHGGSIKAYQNVEDLLNDPEIDVVGLSEHR
ncbi:MAG: Gfo/Idh/MocA family oxidoreductase [Verrucomicrobiota bacterium]|nr:Gfo/Idh/MocA family oxidoreductase [Verrucomicrobiota bacterium]